MAFTRSDLLNDDYKWTTGKEDDSMLQGKPDNSLFNKREGYEVLYMINSFRFAGNSPSVLQGQKIEKMIRHLPGTARSKEDVRRWIIDNWKNY